MIIITEVDDIAVALEELETQMSEVTLLKNTVGIVSVNPEFISSGVYAAVAETVSFPLLGMTAYSQAVNGKIGTYLFSVLILTSDDCEFSHGVSDVISDSQESDLAELTQQCYKNIRSNLAGDVKLVFIYAPVMQSTPAGKYIKAISDIDKKVPIFGSLASAEAARIATEPAIFYGEQVYKNRMTMLLVSGNLSPEFYIGSITKESVIQLNIGEVTAAQDNHVIKINNMNAKDFFEQKGIINGVFKNESINEGILSSVIIMDKKDENGHIVSSTARGILSIEESGCAFAGSVTVGSVLSLAVVTKDVIIATAKEVASQITKNHKDKTILMYSCLGRRISLLDEPMKEFEFLCEELADRGFNFAVLSSGGEICPTSVTGEKVYNEEHNQSLIACVF
jgi:hypothetical protein